MGRNIMWKRSGGDLEGLDCKWNRWCLWNSNWAISSDVHPPNTERPKSVLMGIRTWSGMRFVNRNDLHYNVDWTIKAGALIAEYMVLYYCGIVKEQGSVSQPRAKYTGQFYDLEGWWQIWICGSITMTTKEQDSGIMLIILSERNFNNRLMPFISRLSLSSMTTWDSKPFKSIYIY